MAKQILVLDPEPVVRSTITAILQRHGYTVRSTENLEQAIAAIKQSPPDLLITNIYVPGTTGHDAAKFLKEHCPQMEVLMVTGLPDADGVRKRVNEQQYEIFPKPFKPSDLTEKVKTILS